MLLACSSEPASESEGKSASTASAIINGELDVVHDAVVTVVSDGEENEVSVCTGTIVKIDPASGTGWVATAAHCMSAGEPRAVYTGNDYLSRTRVRHGVVSFAVDERFDLEDPRAGYDFAVVRISGVTSSTPFIPLATAPDDVKVGTPIDNVGFGRTSKPPAEAEGNSRRRIVSTTVNGASERLLGYDSSVSGACQGDSGGPWLVGEGASLRVVGIDSYGNPTCDGTAVAGRVQAGLDFFNVALGLAAPDACELCTTLARSAGGDCADRDDACVCEKACVEQCQASSQCVAATADAGPTEPADAGPVVLMIVTKEGGCSSTGQSPSAWWLALGLVVVRRRPCRTSRR